MARKSSGRQILTGVIGYGGSFNMGMHHLNSMKAAAGLVPCAICDADPARVEQARKDFPGLEHYSDVGEMLKKSPVQLLTVITPHNTHAALAIQCLKAGRHVITEKPFAISVKECDAMIAAARKGRRMLSTYHNRHWDHNVLGLTRAIRKGCIGDVFRVEAASAGYGRPGTWWRSDKKISGGFMFDWGAHFVEWMLQIVDQPMTDISGYFQKRVWDHVTNEDEGIAVVRFGNGAVARLEMSSIAAAGAEMFRILGTKGAITANWESFTVHRVGRSGKVVPKVCKYPKGEHHKFYANIRDHLLEGVPLIITPEWARRVIQVLDYAGISHQKGRSIAVRYP
ncbi:MAG: Gfo/Idh/MocA family oxidoreductase [Planctomycetes bacterium]|nr:Gfo/Idh/MocA family oxidoreductase [Planctomycetota bacterium]